MHCPMSSQGVRVDVSRSGSQLLLKDVEQEDNGRTWL